MPTFPNRAGLPFTAASQQAVEAFDATVMNYLSFSTDTGATLKAMLALDPDMPMAQCLRGYFFMLMGVRPLVGKAGQDALRLNERLRDLQPREQMHARALSAWVTQSLEHATRLWQDIATQHPRDMLALKMASFGHFYTGNSRAIRDSAAAALDFWDASDPEQSYLMCMYAFGLEEAGDPWRAEAVGREALARQPNDAWGVHAVAHALEATGRTDDGVALIDSTAADWQKANNFRYHVAWHKALFLFEQGRYDAALADYDNLVFSPAATEYLDICNDASMLMRLELAEVDVGSRWAAVAAKSEPRTQERIMAFPDLHYVLALASSGDPAHREQARRLSSQIEEHARSGADDASAYAAAAPCARAIVAFREGAYAQAAGELQAALPGLHAIGGSHAQRELFASLAAEALWRADRAAPAVLSLLAARTHAHPHNRRNWALYLDALSRSSDARALAAARSRMPTTH